jgi:hypothetical protein
MSVRGIFISLALNIIAAGIVWYLKGPNAGLIILAVGIAVLIGAGLWPNTKRRTRLAFGKLMEEGKILELRMSESRNVEEFNELGKKMVDWVNRTRRTLVRFDMDTDAGAFLYSGDSPSEPLAQLAIYRAKLQEIVERKNL